MSQEVETYEVKRSALTEILLANARKPISETAQLTGMGARDVAEKYSQLFEERDWLTDRQQERLLLIELGEVLAQSREILSNVDVRDYAGVARVVLANIKLIADRLDARKKVVDSDVMQITRTQARVFGKAFDVALTELRQLILEKYLEVDAEFLDEAVEAGLREAKRVLEEQVKI